MKTGDISTRLGVHPNTLRTWAETYSEFLSDKASGTRPAAKRRYSEVDALTLATIAQLREQGLGHEQIVEALRNGRRVESLPNTPTAEEAQARQSVSLVPMPTLERSLDQVARLQTEIESLKLERDHAIQRGDELVKDHNQQIAALNGRINQLEGDLGRAQGQLAERFSARLVIGLVLFTAIVMVVLIVLLLRA